VRLQGQYADEETGLSYNRWRYFDGDGRFVSADPVGLAGGTNSRRFGVNPISSADPLGDIDVNQGEFSLYHIVHRETGEVAYVGITNDPTRREREHEGSTRASGDYVFREVESDLKFGQARGYEQADIAHLKTLRTCRRGEDIVPGDGNRQRSYDSARELDPRDLRAQDFRTHRLARARTQPPRSR